MRGRNALVWFAAAALLASAVLGLAGCPSGTKTATTGYGIRGTGTAAEPDEDRPAAAGDEDGSLRTQDKPLFEAKVKELAPEREILYSNANQDAAEQQSQADAALTNGAQVLVLDPVDSASAASIVTKAKAKNVPVISYDRLILNAGQLLHLVRQREGRQLQGQVLLDKLTPTATRARRS